MSRDWEGPALTRVDCCGRYVAAAGMLSHECRPVLECTTPGVCPTCGADASARVGPARYVEHRARRFHYWHHELPGAGR